VTITATSEGKTGTASLTVNEIAVSSVSVMPPMMSIVDGTTAAMAFTATTKDAQNHVLTGRVIAWSSSNTAIATIDNQGRSTGQSPGMVTITATSEGKSGTASLTVTPAPVATVAVAPTTQSVVEGSSATFTATLKDGSGNVLTGRLVMWHSTDNHIATIDPSGVATGVKEGTVTITAMSEGKMGSATLTVTAVPVATVAVSPATQTVIDGSTTPAFTATMKDAGGNVLTGRAVAWSSSDNGTATINPATGVATGVSPGTVTITATSEGKTGTASLTVEPAPVATVAVAPPSQSVDVGSSAPAFIATTRDGGGTVVTGRVVTWSSSDDGIATINSATGVATGVSVGTVTITATSEGKIGTASLTVTPPPVASVAVTPPSQTVLQGSTAPAYTATTRDGGGNVVTGRVVTWSSSDDGIATIDNSGVATGVAPGTVTITATSEGKTGTASLEVDPVPVASVTVTPIIASVATGGTTQLTATVRDAANNILTGRVVTWSSGDETVATVDNNGLVTGIAALLGATTITATSEGQTGGSLVTVLGLP
jgi:uncharacterized protein YjdB